MPSFLQGWLPLAIFYRIYYSNEQNKNKGSDFTESLGKIVFILTQQKFTVSY